jgi:hypothetical protein
MKTKQELRELGKQTGLQYVGIEKPFFIFCRQLKPDYIFEEYKFLLEDLTIENIRRMIELRVTRI